MRLKYHGWYAKAGNIHAVGLAACYGLVLAVLSIAVFFQVPFPGELFRRNADVSLLPIGRIRYLLALGQGIVIAVMPLLVNVVLSVVFRVVFALWGFVGERKLPIGRIFASSVIAYAPIVVVDIVALLLAIRHHRVYTGAIANVGVYIRGGHSRFLHVVSGLNLAALLYCWLFAAGVVYSNGLQHIRKKIYLAVYGTYLLWVVIKGLIFSV